MHPVKARSDVDLAPRPWKAEFHFVPQAPQRFYASALNKPLENISYLARRNDAIESQRYARKPVANASHR